ncbi:MAG: hypothetical protein WBX17_07380 [Microbacterium sp.]
MADTTVEAVRAELEALDDPRMREVNERHGDANQVGEDNRNIARLRGRDGGVAVAALCIGVRQGHAVILER